MTESFEERVQRAIDEVVQTHQHDHPLYQETSISARLVDEEQRRAAFVLREQIDTDRATPEDSGWLGDQFRYTLFYVGQEDEPKQLYEDHAYLSPSRQAFTDKRGRDPSIDLVALADDGVVAEVSPKECEGTAYSKLKVKITLDGRVEELENFEDQARNLITRIAPRLGYDYLSGFERLEGQDVAAVRFTTENGRTYGYDTLYLVWKDKEGGLHHQELMDSRATITFTSGASRRRRGVCGSRLAVASSLAVSRISSAKRLFSSSTTPGSSGVRSSSAAVPPGGVRASP